MPSKEKKCVIIGDAKIGKSCLIISQITNCFTAEYVPTHFQHFTANFDINDTPVKIVDISGQETYARIRPLNYSRADVFIVCFSIVDRDTFNNIKLEWEPEIKHHSPRSKIILVGTKLDLCEYESRKVTTEEGEKLAKDIGAKSYVECSAFTMDGVDEVFDSLKKMLGAKN